MLVSGRTLATLLVAVALLAAAGGAVVATWMSGSPEAQSTAPADRGRKARSSKKVKRGKKGPNTVVFVVLDTVRSQNMQLCGYDRPNTPWMVKQRDRGASVTCRAYSPGAWTLPSHSSYFSGLTVPEHGVTRAGHQFTREEPTLAEIYKKRGYQTALVAANPALNKTSGLQRGFDTNVMTQAGLYARGIEAAVEVRKILQQHEPDVPLFLFVNLFDAHDPYPKIPAGVEWVPEQEPVRLHADSQDPDLAYRRYMEGRMGADEAAVYTEQIRNGYDYGIYLVDDTLSRIFKSLRKSGRLELPHRWLVTSDHGEFLGEHGNLRHGCFTYEEVTRVPFLYYDSALGDDQLAFEGALSATNAFFLLRDGELPARPFPANSVSHKRKAGRPSADMATLWASLDDKISWVDGDYVQVDLSRDLDESSPQPLGEHALRPELEAFAEAHRVSLETEPQSEALKDMLLNLGYTD